jgi:hypothetical protein
VVLPERIFPNQDVDSDTTARMIQLWGKPRPNTQNILSFLALGESATLAETPLLNAYVTGVMKATSEMTNGDRRKIAAVRLGAVFYGSVFTHIHGPASLKPDTDVILKVADREGIDVIMDGKSALEDLNAENFHRALNTLLPAVEFGAEYDETTRIGAGAVHLIVMEDQRQALSLHGVDSTFAEVEDPFAALELDPGLADLRRLFDQFGDT